jgi:hypothetical protein
MSHFSPSLSMAASCSTAVPGESIRFGNLEFAKIGSSIQSPIPITPGRPSLSYRELGDYIKEKSPIIPPDPIIIVGS